jgi:uncharacterized protein (TIGR03435 family)
MVRRLPAAILLAASIVRTQAAQLVPNAPTFEDVMVAPNDSHESGTFFNYIRGRLFVTNSTLRMLIRTAYGVQDSEIVGGPEWMNVDRFNIEAKGDVGNSPALPVAHAGDPSRLQLMMQALLADQFKLIVHRERQEADLYAITLLNGDERLGPALAHSDVDCMALAAQARQGNARTRVQTSRCDLSRDVGSLVIGGRPLSQLANSLSAILGKTVVDQSGLTGNFDVHLAWTTDRNLLPESLLKAVRPYR